MPPPQTRNMLMPACLAATNKCLYRASLIEGKNISAGTQLAPFIKTACLLILKKKLEPKLSAS